jgi:hypothetical protein
VFVHHFDKLLGTNSLVLPVDDVVVQRGPV